ncbi:AAA family ATPase [Neorhizobium galegae]|uniref:AAA family ATPase n=1 Tax=Neorhizobium galegae TaxID=399 RepID=UPI0021083C57|nr:AAA family ATPase [Neorhizobium galegae]MCQ1839163.1 AAA family ATPase [Neorhizobium galegae]
MTFTITIPGPTSNETINLDQGTSLMFVGANGGGKTRLAVKIEEDIGVRSHRISAHRSLALNPKIQKISEAEARLGLQKGGTTDGYSRPGHRWQGKAAVALLNDFDFLVQALFAEQTNVAYRNHSAGREGKTEKFAATKLEQLAEIWHRLLPHRKLVLSGDDIRVSVTGKMETYSAEQMSDGERSVFYLVGQVLIAERDSLLIFDEPELHIHRSITGKLWDELEAARQDCAFIIITHDLEFAAARVGKKFVIRDYSPENSWIIEQVPEGTGFDEEVTTAILGSRRPILFTEGTATSLDQAVYRACYPDWTVIPRGSCEEVIHSVVTMRKNAALTRVTCSGIVDADDYEAADVERLNALNIGVLSVSEIENLILLPSVSRAIAEHEGYGGAELEAQLEKLKSSLIAVVDSADAIEAAVLTHCKRRIDRALKKVDLSGASKTVDLAKEFAERLQTLDVEKIASEAETLLKTTISERDLTSLLAIYSNKGMMALAATHLKRTKKDDFEDWLARVLRNDQAPEVKSAIQSVVPKLSAT